MESLIDQLHLNFTSSNHGIVSLPGLQFPRPSRDRELGGSGDDDNFLINPRTGQAYEPYGMAWRYLGVYLDCDGYYDDDYNNGNQKARQRQMSSDDAPCTRKVLWAAYIDPEYSGRSIGEYQFYDFETELYDSDYCIGGENKRCARMDCQEPDTHYELIGVFKETDGLEWFTEQLFKHQGYCLWGSQEYEFMQSFALPTECTELEYGDDDGNSLYMHIDPQPEGNVGIGVYTDEYCLEKASSSWTIEKYIELYYSNNDDDDSGERGSQVARAYTRALEQWNEQMNIYKTCQPCRAYTLHKYNFEDDDEADSQSGSGDHRLRILENDGEGDSEPWGYDCYDDAGYTNCNQCYKFYSQTDMERADVQDLIAASEQGSILQIQYLDGEVYGKGGFYGRNEFPVWWATTAVIIAAASVAAASLMTCLCVWCCVYTKKGRSFYKRFRQRFRQRVEESSLKEGDRDREEEFKPTSLEEYLQSGNDDRTAKENDDDSETDNQTVDTFSSQFNTVACHLWSRVGGQRIDLTKTEEEERDEAVLSQFRTRLTGAYVSQSYGQNRFLIPTSSSSKG